MMPVRSPSHYSAGVISESITSRLVIITFTNRHISNRQNRNPSFPKSNLAKSSVFTNVFYLIRMKIFEEQRQRFLLAPSLILEQSHWLSSGGQAERSWGGAAAWLLLWRRSRGRSSDISMLNASNVDFTETEHFSACLWRTRGGGANKIMHTNYMLVYKS